MYVVFMQIVVSPSVDITLFHNFQVVVNFTAEITDIILFIILVSFSM
jgi:hypothetical protein